MDTGSGAAAFPAFVPRPPWLTGDLQTLRNFLRPPRRGVLAAWRETRCELTLADGDRLLAHVHAPAAPRATVVLIHGLTGCADSAYVLASARHFLSSGFAVVRLNLRGAGPARPSCRLQYHAGRTQDLREALRAFANRHPDLARGPLFAIGYSLGANMLLKYLGEEGRATPLRGAMVVSAPIDLAAASTCLMSPRNRFYHGCLMNRMRAEALAPAADLTAAERRAVLTARTVFEFDDRFVAPRNGFAGAVDYYRRASAQGYLGGIGVPALIVHALDDPWIPPESYRRVNWRALPLVTPLLPPRGGHVGFHGVGSRVPWHDRCGALFADRLLAGEAAR